jgi:ribosomal protein L37E
MYSEPVTENGTCKRCGRRTRILSNGYCTRCDDVMFGYHLQPQNTYPSFQETKPKYPKRKILMC